MKTLLLLLLLAVGADRLPQAPPLEQAPPCCDEESAPVRLHVYADGTGPVFIDEKYAGRPGLFVTAPFPKGRAYTWTVEYDHVVKDVNAAAGAEVIVDFRKARFAGPAVPAFQGFPAFMGGMAGCSSGGGRGG